MYIIVLIIIIYFCELRAYEFIESRYGIKYMKANDSIFFFNQTENNRTDFCNVYCSQSSKSPENIHTICFQVKKSLKLKTKCSTFQIFPKIKLDYDYGLELENAHNGIRNRIAAKMRVANMQQILWDDELGRMAESFLQKCEFYSDDQCANLSEDYNDREGSPWELLAMNRFTIFSEFYPIDIIEQAIQAWYGEKNYMTAPTSLRIGGRSSKSYIGQISDDNNFTHMAFPQLQKFGCSLAVNAKIYCLVCYYYPYLHKKYEFRYGKCCNDCNYNYALQSTSFSNLCSNMGASHGIASIGASNHNFEFLTFSILILSINFDF